MAPGRTAMQSMANALTSDGAYTEANVSVSPSTCARTLV